MAHPMGESKPGCLRVVFDRRLKLEFHGSKITVNGGAKRDHLGGVRRDRLAAAGLSP